MTEEKDLNPRGQQQREAVLEALRQTYLIMDALGDPDTRARFVDMLCAHYDYRPEPTAEDVVALLVRGVERSGGPALDGGLMSKMLGMMKSGPVGVVKPGAGLPGENCLGTAPRCSSCGSGSTHLAIVNDMMSCVCDECHATRPIKPFG